MNKLLLFLLLLMTTLSYAQLSDCFKSIDNSSIARGIAADDSGNVYIVGAVLSPSYSIMGDTLRIKNKSYSQPLTLMQPFAHVMRLCLNQDIFLT